MPLCVSVPRFFSEASRERVLVQTARAFLRDRNGVAAGGRVLRRHVGHFVEAGVVDLQSLERVRDAKILAQLQHPVEERLKAGLKPDIGGESLDLRRR